MNRWWRIAGGLAMNLPLGTLYAWSVFVAPLEARIGADRSEISMAFTIAIVAFAAAFLVAGRFQDRYGPLGVSIAGGLLTSLGYFMCARADSLPYLYAWFGGAVGLGTGLGYTTPIPVMAKWFPDHRGLAVGLAVAGFGGGSAIFGPLCAQYLIPAYGLAATFRILAGIFLVMTMIGAVLLRDPPEGYRPAGWTPPPTATASATGYDFTPAEVLRTRTFYLMWAAFALGASSGLMVISQLKPFAEGRGVAGAIASTAVLVGAAGSASGRALAGWLSDAIGRLNALRLMIGLSVAAMPLLHAAAGSVAGLFALVFVVYWCFGTQLSVNPSTAADFWGTKHAGINYGMLYTAYGVAGVIGPWIGARVFVLTHSYRAAFDAAAVLAAVALACELLARRPGPPAGAGTADLRKTG